MHHTVPVLSLQYCEQIRPSITLNITHNRHAPAAQTGITIQTTLPVVLQRQKEPEQEVTENGTESFTTMDYMVPEHKHIHI